MMIIQLHRIINLYTVDENSKNSNLRLSNLRLENSLNLATGIQIFPRLHNPNSTILQSYVTYRLLIAQYIFAL